jgi:iron(II)-dependent oxidoreductase
MKRGYLLIAAGCLATVALGGVFARWYAHKEEEERLHFVRQETELIATTARKSELVLSKSGTNISEAAQVMAFNGARLWLKPGTYFLRSTTPEGTYFYPIPILGYRRGPDEDGNFILSIRIIPTETPPLLDATLPHYAYIPSGNFLNGDRLNPREPHYVWLTGYFINPFETTNMEFREFLHDSAGYGNSENWCGAGKNWKSTNSSHATALLGPHDRDFARFGRDDLPVLWVNWFEANAYCRWLTHKIGRGRWQFSLPTDAEWEKAARGPDNFDYALGMTLSDAEVKLYNWKKNPDAPVTVIAAGDSRRLYDPNRYGLYHMTGNASEWSQSVSKPYNREHPYDDDERNLDDTPGQRSVRGGSWYSASIAYLYIPYRDSFQPEHCNQEVGFRIVARMLP